MNRQQRRAALAAAKHYEKCGCARCGLKSDKDRALTTKYLLICGSCVRPTDMIMAVDMPLGGQLHI